MPTYARMARRPRRRLRGSILLDCIIALTFLSMGAASFYSLFPIVSKAHAEGVQEQKATQICTKLLEHIQLLSPGKLTYTNLSGMQLINSTPATSPYSFTNCPLDDATDYSPAKALKNGSGTLTITNLSYGNVQAIATVTWTSPTGKTETCTMGTILGSYRS